MSLFQLDLLSPSDAKIEANTEAERALSAVTVTYRMLVFYLDICAKFAFWQDDLPISASTETSAVRSRVTEKRPAGRTKAQQGPLWLSQRERECIQLAARGMSDGEIGKKLGLSEKTVNEYIERVKRKFDVHRRVEAIVLAIKLNLIES